MSIVTSIQSVLNSTAVIDIEKLFPLLEPQRAYMWEVMITGSSVPSVNSAIMKTHAKSISIPSSSVSVIQDKFMGESMFFPGPDSSPKTVTMTLWDDQGMTIFRYLKSWLNLMHSQADATGRAVDKRTLAADMTITLKDTLNFFTILTIKMNACMITSVGDVQLSYDAGDIVTLSAEFVYDEMYISDGKQNPLSLTEPTGLIPSTGN